MRPSFIDRIYNGNIRPVERTPQSNAERDTVEHKIKAEKAYLASQLSPEDGKRLERLEELYTEYSAHEVVEGFGCGLRFGIRMMYEVMAAEE